MAIRSKSTNNSQLEQVKPPKVSVKREQVKIRLTYPCKYIYPNLSGDRVVFERAGSIQLVSREDATILLSKTVVGGCCGSGSKVRNIFEEVT